MGPASSHRELRMTNPHKDDDEADLAAQFDREDHT
ncbi:hypothetical protein BJD66_gp38 [Gordonia phage Emalyn]|uniref:Uncharacterized protein n=1 Tax=Gordonia phage Emalyn TaxID=1821552 RepID=A0A142KBX4_9CAUD|nr:hypothetical protein BJD66_gp38 [Gordonia phage Emalyn]AMS03607.1 hypothetical protein SEA_EMALYN_38 [Gordonia phage Emalyn]QXN73607.1 hypothetical protein SEA_AIKOCARSON_39 [Gordonia phage AikoCarson]UMO76162.1 hypothetical protein SEA_AMOK_39 [Gordonia phage Amok]